VRLLLYSHPLIWYVDQDYLLSTKAHAEITDPNNDLWISAATVWEISIKYGLGKLTLSLPYRQWIEKAIADLSLAILPITVEYADAQSRLPYHHGDPFDRLLIAQSFTDAIPIVSADSQFDAYGVTRVW
jgi:PIN domain nuclease of toxin-antitoxin system